jgi:hypothetical protein
LPTQSTIDAFAKRVAAILQDQRCPNPELSAQRLAPHILASELARQARRSFLAAASKQPAADVVRWIAEARDAGETDEAFWRASVAAHFGRLSALEGSVRQAESAGRFLCGFGQKPHWTWQRVASDLDGLRDWLDDHAEQLLSLQFGNHRHFESHQPTDLYRVIRSFVDWVNDHGHGSPEAAFATAQAADSEARFDILYHRLRDGVDRFGRLGAFDFVDLLGDMDLLIVRPGSPYLADASGPWTGALLVWGSRPVGELDACATELAARLKVPVQAIEDALCNSQKP